MNSLVRLFFVGIFLLALQGARAQDIHFSHIHASPMALNPAMTGVFEGNLRLIGNYRNQWKSVTADYKTFMVSADANFASPGGNSVIGVGAQIVNDVAGDLDFTTNSSTLSFSAMQSFNDDKSHILAGGISTGLIGTRFDPSKIISYDNEPLLNEEGVNQNSYLDISAGLLWFMKMKQGDYYFLGASALHVNNPVVSFFNQEEPETLYRRFVFHGGANFNLNKQYTLIPNFIFMSQGPHRELTLGSFFRYNNPNRKKGEATVMLGAWLRGNSFTGDVKADAVIAALRLDYNNLTLSFSYDINISSLSQISTGRGGPEFSLIYTIGKGVGSRGNKESAGKTNKKSGIKCPVF